MYHKLSWNEKILVNPDTGKEWRIEIDGNCIRSCLNHGKVKEQIVESGLSNKAVQLMMAKMRKGFLYDDPNAGFGEAFLHRFLSKAYTGFMPIAARPDTNEFYAVRTIGDFEDEILYHFGEDCSLLDTYSLGARRMTYKAVWAADGTLYLDNNHCIEHYLPDSHEIISIAGPANRFDSSLDAKGNHVMWFGGQGLVVRDVIHGSEVWRKKIVCEKTGSSLPEYYCFSRLSPLGGKLLYRAEKEICHVVDLKTAEELLLPAEDGYCFFSPDERCLYIGDRVFDLQTGTEVAGSGVSFISGRHQYVVGYTDTIPEGSNLLAAPCGRDTAVIWNYEAGQILASISDDFIVRSADYALTKDRLIVHTDYGVLSVYNVCEDMISLISECT